MASSIPKVLTESTDEMNLLTFRGIKSRFIGFLGFLSVKRYLAIETTQYKTKRRVKCLLVRVKTRRRVLMMIKSRRGAGTQARKVRITDE